MPRCTAVIGWLPDTMSEVAGVTSVRLDYDGLEIEIEAESDRPPTLRRLRAGAAELLVQGPGTPLVEILSPAFGHDQPVRRLSGTLVGTRLRYRSHRPCAFGFVLELADAEAMIVVELRLTSQAPATVRATCTVRNDGAEPFVLSAVTSLNLPVTGRVGDLVTRVDDIEVVTAHGDWTGEGRWQHQAHCRHW